MNRKWLFGLLPLLSGCLSMSNEEQREHLIAPPTMQSSIEKGLESPFFAEGDWPDPHWWEIFHSDQLSELIEEALSKNPDIQAVESKIAFARQTAKVVRSKLFPLLYFNAEETWQYLSHNGLYRALNPKVEINPNLVDLTLSFTYEFDFWGKNRNLFQAALGRQKAEEAEAAQVELIVTTALAEAYFALKTNLIRKSLYEDLYAVRHDIHSLETLLEEKALLSRLSPLFSQEQVREAEKLLFSIDAEIAANRHFINILAGRGPDAPLEIDEELPALPEALVLPKDLSIDLLARRPDLMAQIWRVEAHAHEVGAAKADFFPTINLGAFAGVESTLYSLLFKSDSKMGGLSPAIHLPIFTAGAIRANLRAKKALFDEAVYEYNQLILKSAQEVTDLLAFAESIFSQKCAEDQIVQEAIERYELTALREENGLDNAIGNYAYEEEVIWKKIDQVQLLFGEYLTTIKLMKALGGGYLSEYQIPLTAKQEASHDR